MSKGMQQRLGIAQAMVGSPRVLLLDEPTSALDPVGRRTVRTLLEELQRRGVSVLLNSHLLSEIELVCDRVVILLGGRVVTAGTPAELARPRGVEIELPIEIFHWLRHDNMSIFPHLLLVIRQVIRMREKNLPGVRCDHALASPKEQ